MVLKEPQAALLLSSIVANLTSEIILVICKTID